MNGILCCDNWNFLSLSDLSKWAIANGVDATSMSRQEVVCEILKNQVALIVDIDNNQDSSASDRLGCGHGQVYCARYNMKKLQDEKNQAEVKAWEQIEHMEHDTLVKFAQKLEQRIVGGIKRKTLADEVKEAEENQAK